MMGVVYAHIFFYPILLPHSMSYMFYMFHTLFFFFFFFFVSAFVLYSNSHVIYIYNI